MSDHVNARPGHCLFCATHVAAREGQLVWCEDGSPVHCERHFDMGGWEVACMDAKACDGRRREALAQQKAYAEEQKATAARLREERQQKVQAWQDRRAGILAGHPAATAYGPYQAYVRSGADWFLKDGPALELIAEADLRDPRFPMASHPWPMLFAVEGMDAILEIETSTNSQKWHTNDEARNDQWRLEWARRHGVTIADAQEVAGGGYEFVGADQRRMYEMVLAAEPAAGKA